MHTLSWQVMICLQLFLTAPLPLDLFSVRFLTLHIALLIALCIALRMALHIVLLIALHIALCIALGIALRITKLIALLRCVSHYILRCVSTTYHTVYYVYCISHCVSVEFFFHLTLLTLLVGLCMWNLLSKFTITQYFFAFFFISHMQVYAYMWAYKSVCTYNQTSSKWCYICRATSKDGKDSSKIKALNDTILRMNEKNVRLTTENKSLKEDLEKLLHQVAETKEKKRMHCLTFIQCLFSQLGQWCCLSYWVIQPAISGFLTWVYLRNLNLWCSID